MRNDMMIAVAVLLAATLLLTPSTALGMEMDYTTRNRLLAVNYLGRTNMPRGMRNNNPGNIRISSAKWQGKLPVSENTDGAFEQFNGYAWGVRAMIVLLRGYIDRDGLTTLRGILNKYAPPSENHTGKYVNTVAQWTGIGPDQAITSDVAFLRKIVPALARYENGMDAVDDDMFTLAYILS